MDLFAPESVHDDLFYMGADDSDAEMSEAGSSQTSTPKTPSRVAANRGELLANNVGAQMRVVDKPVQVDHEREARKRALRESRKMHLCFQPPLKSAMTKSKLGSMEAAFFDEDHNKYIIPENATTAQWIGDIANGTTDPRSTRVLYVLVPEDIPTLVQPMHPDLSKRAIEPQAPDADPHKWIVFSNSKMQYKGRITEVHIRGRATTGYVVIESFQQIV